MNGTPAPTDAASTLAAELSWVERVHGRTPKTLSLVETAVRDYGPEVALDALAILAAERRGGEGR